MASMTVTLALALQGFGLDSSLLQYAAVIALLVLFAILRGVFR